MIFSDAVFSSPPDEGKEPVLALGGVSLSIEQGSFVTILGHGLPPLMTTTRSARAASSMWWVMRTMVMPFSRLRSFAWKT